MYSPAVGARGGVAIMYKKEYFDEIISTYKDNVGRVCSLKASKNGDIYLFLNIYAPTEHVDAPEFYETLDDVMKESFW
jgi:hypothetical protein